MFVVVWHCMIWQKLSYPNAQMPSISVFTMLRYENIELIDNDEPIDVNFQYHQRSLVCFSGLFQGLCQRRNIPINGRIIRARQGDAI